MDDDESIGWENLTTEQLDWENRFRHALGSLPGYAGVEWRQHAREVAVYATSRPDGAVSDLIRRAPQGISVTWHDAPFAFADLDAEVHRLMGQHPSIVEGGANSDGTGISLLTTNQRLASAPDQLGTSFPVLIEYPHGPMPV